MEAAVNIHTEQTTASDQSQLGIMTCSKPKLITPERKLPQASKKLLWQTYQRQQQRQNSHTHTLSSTLEEVVQHSSACTTTQEHTQPAAPST